MHIDVESELNQIKTLYDLEDVKHLARRLPAQALQVAAGVFSGQLRSKAVMMLAFYASTRQVGVQLANPLGRQVAAARWAQACLRWFEYTKLPAEAERFLNSLEKVSDIEHISGYEHVRTAAIGAMMVMIDSWNGAIDWSALHDWSQRVEVDWYDIGMSAGDFARQRRDYDNAYVKAVATELTDAIFEVWAVEPR